MKGEKFLVWMPEEGIKVLFPVVVHDMDNFMQGPGKSTFEAILPKQTASIQ